MRQNFRKKRQIQGFYNKILGWSHIILMLLATLLQQACLNPNTGIYPVKEETSEAQQPRFQGKHKPSRPIF